jgi:hypothetical protein
MLHDQNFHRAGFVAVGRSHRDVDCIGKRRPAGLWLARAEFNTTYMEWESNASTTDELMRGIVWDLELETMPFKLPDMPTRIAPVVRAYLHVDTATGSGVIQVKEFEFFQVDAPDPKGLDRTEEVSSC